MTNAELIKALRKCEKQSPDRCWDCEYYDREPWCESALANDAAAALKAAENRIAELEAQLPKDGKWIPTGQSLAACSNCGNCVSKERTDGMFYCPNCGSRMRKGEQE